MQSPPPPPPPGPPPHPVYHPPGPTTMENGGYSPGPKSSPAMIFCLSFSHNITQLLIGGVVVSALLLPNIFTFFTDSFIQHVILCTVGYFILMSQAIMSISPFGYASHLKKEHKTFIHAGLQIAGSIMAITGSIIRMVDLDNNFDTAHGICGIIAMVLAFCNLIGGAFTLILRNMNFIKIIHSLIGALTLTMAYITIILAFHNYFRSSMGDRNANLAIVFSVFALVGTLLMTMIRIGKRILNL